MHHLVSMKGDISPMVKGCTKDERLYVLMSMICEDTKTLEKISPTLLELFLRSNVLLSFGALGYTECGVRVVYTNATCARFIVQVTQRNLSKLQLIAANRFPAKLHIELADLIGSTQPIALHIDKYSTNMWYLIS